MIFRLTQIYDFFRYDIPYGVKNLIKFFPIIWKHRNWDSHYTLKLFRKGLIELERVIRTYSHEIDEDRIPKEKAMQECIQILTNIIEDNYIDQAKVKLNRELSDFKFKTEPNKEFIYIDGPNPKYRKYTKYVDQRTKAEQESDSEIFNLSFELEKQDWDRLWTLIKGNDNIKGSHMRGWWD